MKVYINKNIPLNEEGKIFWSAKNGATRRILMFVQGKNSDEIIIDEQRYMIECSLGYLDKGNHSFIFVNNPKPNDDRIMGIFLCDSYGYTMLKGKEIFANSSVGGYGNSESKFGIYEVGSIIAQHSYKNRRGDIYWKLTENGWIVLEQYDPEIIDKEVKEI